MADLTKLPTARREVGVENCTAEEGSCLSVTPTCESMPLEEGTISMMREIVAIEERGNGRASARKQEIYDIISELFELTSPSMHTTDTISRRRPYSPQSPQYSRRSTP